MIITWKYKWTIEGHGRSSLFFFRPGDARFDRTTDGLVRNNRHYGKHCSSTGLCSARVIIFMGQEPVYQKIGILIWYFIQWSKRGRRFSIFGNFFCGVWKNYALRQMWPPKIIKIGILTIYLHTILIGMRKCCAPIYSSEKVNVIFPLRSDYFRYQLHCYSLLISFMILKTINWTLASETLNFHLIS